jgi:hypothetical protein
MKDRQVAASLFDPHDSRTPVLCFSCLNGAKRVPLRAANVPKLLFRGAARRFDRIRSSGSP